MSLIELPDMAKKKSKPPDTGWLEKPQKPVVAQIRGSEAFKAWLDQLCKYDHRKLSDLFEVAVARYARDIGFKEEPPAR